MTRPFACELDLTGVDDAFRARFWSKVNRAGAEECWTWSAYRIPSGYGMFTIRKGTYMTASRVALALTVGRPLRLGEVACHHCDNPPCVNPSHLFAGTQTDNALDKIRKGRGNPTHGEARCSSKLTEVQVREILAEPHRFGIYRELGRVYGVSNTVIKRIRQRTLWAHIDAEVNLDKVCANGHLLAGENLLPDPDPSRRTLCATCAEDYRVSRLRTQEAA